MGTIISRFGNRNDENKNVKIKTCYKCSKKINETSYVICVRCNISLHEYCEASYGYKYYTVCPRCDRCGSLGTIHIRPLIT